MGDSYWKLTMREWVDYYVVRFIILIINKENYDNCKKYLLSQNVPCLAGNNFASLRAIIENVRWSNSLPPETVCNLFTRPISSIFLSFNAKFYYFYFLNCYPTIQLLCISILVFCPHLLKVALLLMCFSLQISFLVGFMNLFTYP